MDAPLELEALSARIRRTIVERAYAARVGHIGSALSIVDLVAALYGGVLRVERPDDVDRDRFILSKGHAALALYAALRERGIIDAELLASYCGDDTPLGTHPEHEVPGIDFSTGSLGHGLSIAAGAALAARLQGSRRRSFAIVSDGECDEGSLWEAVMFAAQHRLANLVVLVDANEQQAFGYTRDVLDLSPLAGRFRAFGWEAHDVDGHDPGGLVRLIEGLDTAEGLPRVLVAHTVFGRGVSFMERKIDWHYWPLDDARYAEALADLDRLDAGGVAVRNAFAAWLCERAELDERVLLLTGDLGFTVLERFVERYPRRFFNVGVAEQNMIGLATGLAEAGFRPFAYSIASFASMRPYEFIRNGPVLHRLPVCVVGVGGGLDYGHNGVTHFALEDVALMRVQPDITTVVPADREQARSALEVIAALERPVYLRLGRTGEPVPGLDGAFALGRVALLAPGRDVLLVALGPQVHVAQAAAGLLRDAGVEAAVALVSSFNPSPDEDLRALLAGAPLAVTLEGHYRTGGLGSYVSELVAEAGFGTRVRRMGVEAMPRGLTGSESFLAQRLGLDAAAAARAALDGLGRG